MKSLSIKVTLVDGECVVVKNIQGYNNFQDFAATNNSFKWVTFNDVSVNMAHVVKLEELKDNE
ncbi:hypothetical protein ABR763_01250 [Bacillus cereus]